MKDTKRCNNCKEDKSLDEFYKCSNRKDLRQNNCKVCAGMMSSKWSNDNRNALKEKVDVEKRKESSKNWYENNKKKHKENVMRYNKDHYDNDPYYRLSKELYHLVYRYLQKNGERKFDTTFGMLGYSAEELNEYFKEDIEAMNENGLKHRLELIIPFKFFADGTPVDVVCSLLNLRIICKDADKSPSRYGDTYFIGEGLYVTVIPKFIKRMYFANFVNCPDKK